MSTYKANSLNEAAPKKAGRPRTKPLIDLTDFDFTEEDLIAGLSDPQWRLSHLYRIVDAKKNVVVFKPNDAQQYLLDNMHTRQVILKARKLGFSTLISILGLDTAIFSPNERVVFIAQDRDSAESIFRDTIRFAYDNLPEPFKNAAPLDGSPSKSGLAFTNGSTIEVKTSSRGGTPTFLWVSELGKISARDPGKSKEIVTGSITSVAEDGLIFVESTAEGQEGTFYDLVKTAREYQESGKALLKISFKFFFYGWWQDKRYTVPPESVVLTKRDEEYFEELEQEIGRKLTPGQKAWRAQYCAVTYSGDEELFWQEMPATPDEAFKVSLEGAYFKDQFKQIRKDRRIGHCPYDDMFPVSTFWDLGASDATAIWLIQARRTYYAVIGYIEASGEPYSYFINELERLGYVYDTHYLPHDAAHRRQGGERNLTPEEMILTIAPYFRTYLVPRTNDKIMAIQQARILLGQCVFDEANCSEGLKRLESYRKEWNPRTGMWKATPRHDISSNAADAFLQAAQAKASGAFSSVGKLGGAFGNDFGSDFIEEPALGF